jgi:2-polyprenyl-3-methyl-5-hydroxy-6-metoxy-1,4-benzoquinol methylase
VAHSTDEREYFDKEFFTLHEGKARYVQALVGVLRRHGIASGRVLDVGAGFGFFLRALEQQGYDAYGLESSEYACERAREFTNATIANASAERVFPFDDDFFDAITMFDVIEHIADYPAMLAECKRTLRPGGRIVVMTPSGHSIARLLLGKNWSWHKDPTHVHLFTPRSMRRALHEAQFSDLRCITLFNFYIVGDSTTSLTPLRAIRRFVRAPWIGDSLLAVASA